MKDKKIIQTGRQILDQFGRTVQHQAPDMAKSIQVQATTATIAIHDIHARAMGCHCECMGMNADNCNAATNGQTAPYDEKSYHEVMRKWGMVDDSGKPII